MKLPNESIIVSGPVIIEKNKVLLVKENKKTGKTPWYFPGGEVEDFDLNLEEACRREVKEELGIDVEIIQPLKPMIIRRNGKAVVLIQYLTKRIGEIKPGKDVAEFGWHDINNLPNDCAPNVYEVVASLKIKN
jgi:ADP-ribose pyrophosphatase YjhB (NUDIX family)